jgi:DNA invertase Pin-like site-specific DNA recombinase
LLVCHSCDNPLCVKPNHLFLGTVKDNAEDMVKKGRSPKGNRHGSQTKPQSRPRGEKHGSAKLSEDQVKEIRSLRESGIGLNEIAAQYGVCFQLISLIARKKIWKHIT